MAIFNLPQIAISGPEIAPTRVVCDHCKMQWRRDDDGYSCNTLQFNLRKRLH
jgi:hypothetical protein